jgi:hypothetical protein
MPSSGDSSAGDHRGKVIAAGGLAATGRLIVLR